MGCTKEKIKNSDEIILELPGDTVKSLSWGNIIPKPSPFTKTENGFTMGMERFRLMRENK